MTFQKKLALSSWLLNGSICCTIAALLIFGRPVAPEHYYDGLPVVDTKPFTLSGLYEPVGKAFYAPVYTPEDIIVAIVDNIPVPERKPCIYSEGGHTETCRQEFERAFKIASEK